MNFLDIVLIGIVSLFLLRGFFRGLVQEILSLIAVILAVVLASRYHPLVAPHLKLYFTSEMTVSVLSYVLIFLATIIIFWLLAKFIKSILEISLLGWIDRLAGGVFGIIEGILISLICLMFLQTFAPDSDFLNESYLAPRTQHMVELLSEHAPESMRETLKTKGFNLPSPQEALDSAKEAVGLDDDGSPE